MRIKNLIEILVHLNSLCNPRDWEYNVYFKYGFVSLETRYPYYKNKDAKKKDEPEGHLWKVWRFDYDKYSDPESELIKIIQKRIKYHDK